MNERIIFKMSIARKLLKLGYKIIDLKPQKNKYTGELDFSRCYFIFEYKNGIDGEIKKLLNK